ncbi:MAG: hypothetical protein IKV27_03795 [Lachnospiraceae bacterium]|nr:hypothetical protein [Lachnospiraceae bacterium]
MDARLCVGNYGVHPFCFEGLNLKVYCVEELCFCLKENAYLLDTDIMGDRLVDWLRQECGLEDLAGELHRMVHRKGSFSAFVACILEYTGFYDAETVQKAVQTLKQGAGLNVLEKRKLRIDSLVEQRKFLTAVREYDVLLTGWDEAAKGNAQQGTGLYAALLHNKGTALAGLMKYEEAAESFFAAYDADGAQESLLLFLAAKRMGLKDQDYIAFVASVPEYSENALALEKEVEKLNEQWEKEVDRLRLAERALLREEDERSYLDDNCRLLQVLKEDYRMIVG